MMSGLRIPEQVAAPLSKVVREPIVAFLIIAGLIFAMNALVAPSNAPRPVDRIEVSEGRVIQIAESYRLLTGSPPAPDELRNLVADFVDEEIAYREAIAMGLDQDDTIIRRRLRQKLEFMMLDAAVVEPPTEQDLRDWFAENRSRYQTPERRALDIITFLSDRGEAFRRAQSALGVIQQGGDPSGLGDPTLLPEAVPLTTQRGISRQFSDQVAEAAFAATPGQWAGPVRSGFGAHLIRARDVAPPHQPEFADLREQLLEDYTRIRESEALEQRWRDMRARYDVSIQWPGGRPAGADAGAQDSGE